MRPTKEVFEKNKQALQTYKINTPVLFNGEFALVKDYIYGDTTLTEIALVLETFPTRYSESVVWYAKLEEVTALD